MNRRFSLSLALGVLALLASSVLAQKVGEGEALPKAPDALVALMTKEDLPATAQYRVIAETRPRRAAGALMGMKDDAIPALTKGLMSEDPIIRLNVVYVLECIGTPATLPLRINAVVDAAPRVRIQAVRRLPAYTSHEARQALFKSLKDPDPGVRNAAMLAFRPRDPKNLPDDQLRSAAAWEIIPLLEDPATQYVAADTLGRLEKNSAARPLLKLLKAPDKQVRCAVVSALGQLKDKQVTVELTEATRDDDPFVRMYAAMALGQIGDLRATPALLGMLSEKESFLRRDAARALGQIADVRAAPGLTPLLEDPDEQVRWAAAEALGQIGDARSVEPLCKAVVRDGNAAAARALGRLRDARAIEPLTTCLLGLKANDYCAKEAAGALVQIRHGDAVAAIVKVIVETRDRDVFIYARHALGDVTGHSFTADPPETIANWWKQNREHYLRPAPEKK